MFCTPSKAQQRTLAFGAPRGSAAAARTCADASLPQSNLALRFRQDQIYTYVGTVLIAINPFRLLPLYTTDVLEKCAPAPPGPAHRGGRVPTAQRIAAAGPCSLRPPGLGPLRPLNLAQPPPCVRARAPGLPSAPMAPQTSRSPLLAAWAWRAGAPQRARKPHRYCVRALLTRLRCARYHENGSVGQKPHTYAIADNAYRNLVRDWKARRSALRNTTPPPVARPARAATPGLAWRLGLQGDVRRRSRVPRRPAGPKHHRVRRVRRWQD